MSQKTYTITATIGIIAIITVLAICMANKPKEAFTELYFENLSNIDSFKNMSLNESGSCSFSFSFTIVSHEKEKKNYTYLIDSKIIKQEGTIALEPEENKTIKIELKPNKIVSNDKLTISLDDLSIYFYYGVG